MTATMVLLAGPNGAGKSTLYETRVRPGFAGPFINADQIQRAELGDATPEAAYDAARIAADRRAQYLEAGRSFATETVFSHPSKLDLIHRARARGFLVILLHVGIESADLSVARVGVRVEEGGHDVPEQKIRDRFARNGTLIREAMLAADLGHVYDNSRLNVPPERVLSFRAGRVSYVKPILPEWVLGLYRRDLTL